MNLIRILVIALIVYLLIQIAKRWLANNQSVEKNSMPSKRMVRCEICQLHVPENEALENEGKYYCCQEHYNRKQKNN